MKSDGLDRRERLQAVDDVVVNGSSGSGLGIRRDHCDSSYSLVLNLLVLNEHLRLFGRRDHCDSWALVTKIIAIAGPCSQYQCDHWNNLESQIEIPGNPVI